MANKKLENQELRKKVNDLEKRIESLETRNRSLIQQHMADAHKMSDLLTNQEEALKQIEQIYKSYMVDLVEMFGEVVEDDDKTIIGKRIEIYPPEKMHEHEFDARVSTEDSRIKVVFGITYKEGEEDE